MKLLQGIFILIPLAMTSVIAHADDDDWNWRFWQSDKSRSVPANPLYKQECGACHMPYPAFLLPAASWNRVMDGLADHFGDNAELGASEGQQIRDYLLANAADKSGTRLGQKIARSGEAGLRISKTAYIQRKHRGELPRDVFKKSDKLTTLAQCDGCHPRAADGSFREGEIRIPGYGRWED